MGVKSTSSISTIEYARGILNQESKALTNPMLYFFLSLNVRFDKTKHIYLLFEVSFISSTKTRRHESLDLGSVYTDCHFMNGGHGFTLVFFYKYTYMLWYEHGFIEDLP